MSSYLIKRGDTLSALAHRFHTTVRAIDKANAKIHDPNLIYAGDRITIPGQHKAAHPKPAHHKASSPKPAHHAQPTHSTHSSSGSSGKVKKMLDVARSALGYHEGANNSNRFSHAMGRPSEAWCADFVSYCAKKAGIHTVNTASAQQVQNQLAAKHRWKGKHNPQPGDAVTFDWQGRNGWADHVGIVEKTVHKNGHLYIQTIEGNSSNGVHRRTYLASSAVIKGYGRMA